MAPRQGGWRGMGVETGRGSKGLKKGLRQGVICMTLNRFESRLEEYRGVSYKDNSKVRRNSSYPTRHKRHDTNYTKERRN